MILSIAAMLAVASATTTLAVADIAEPNPKAMKQSEIRAFNAKLDKSHKYYIRCKRRAPTGSFVSREFSCRTNEQWSAAEDRGNQESRDIMDEMKSKSWNTSG